MRIIAAVASNWALLTLVFAVVASGVLGFYLVVVPPGTSVSYP